jgi:hypothetical protein
VPAAQNGAASDNSGAVHGAHLTLPAGTSLDITLNTSLTSESASVGDAWSGSVRSTSTVDGHSVIPAGSQVAGTVSSVTTAHKGDRAMLDLELSSVAVGNDHYRVHGSMESVIAGSTRARNLGAIAATTVAGAVIGHAIGGSGTGTVVGGVVGAGAGAVAVNETKGYQVALKAGTPLTFTTTEALAVRQ